MRAATAVAPRVALSATTTPRALRGGPSRRRCAENVQTGHDDVRQTLALLGRMRVETGQDVAYSDGALDVAAQRVLVPEMRGNVQLHARPSKALNWLQGQHTVRTPRGPQLELRKKELECDFNFAFGKFVHRFSLQIDEYAQYGAPIKQDVLIGGNTPRQALGVRAGLERRECAEAAA